MEIYRLISGKIWAECFWLPENITWKDLEPGSRTDIRFSGGPEIFWSIPVAFGYILIRYIFQKLVFEPVGKSYGIKGRHTRFPKPNTILETAYKTHKKLDRDLIIALTKQTDMTERQVERWLRCRANIDQPTTLDKFSETFFQFLYYLSIFTFGCVILYEKPYMFDFRKLLADYPFQSMEDFVAPYYILSMAYYISLTLYHFVDAKRKDFWQMLIHHCVAMFLVSISWYTNNARAGSWIILVHDCADVFLYLVKILKYLNLHRACHVMFMVFLSVWTATRLVWFGRFIYVGFLTVETIPAVYLYATFLLVQYCLHWYWSSMSYRILYLALRYSKSAEQKDVRSDTSEMSASEDEASNGVKSKPDMDESNNNNNNSIKNRRLNGKTLTTDL